MPRLAQDPAPIINFSEIVVSRLNWPAAVLLLIAAVLKLVELCVYPPARTGDFVFPPGILILFEFWIACWLASEFKPTISKNVGACVFSFFLMILMAKWYAGEKICGCYGVLQIPIWYSIVNDFIALICLSLWQPNLRRNSQRRIRCWRNILLFFVFITVILHFTLPRPKFDVARSSEGDILVLSPERWIGQKLPLADFIEGDAGKLDEGVWKIVLYAESCPKCQTEISKIVMSGDQTFFLETSSRVDSSLRKDSASQCWRNLDSKYHWFVSLPTTIVVEDNVVLKVVD
jgi:hypothetical protein